MKRITISFLALLIAFNPVYSQDSSRNGGRPNPYKLKPITDGAIILGGIGLTALGVKLINDKRNLTDAELAAKEKESVFFLDKSSRGFYDKKMDDASYIPFQASFAMPVLMALIDKNERSKFGQLMVLYTETMAVTGSLFTMATGNVYRSRPYVYNTSLDPEFRKDKNSQRAFYAGHTAATAAATFFMAKAFHDFNPGSKAQPYVWGLAAAVPALVGYMRYKAGMHFLSDNLLGYGMGAAAGLLVPQLHKSKKFRNVSFVPYAGGGDKGLAIVYHLR